MAILSKGIDVSKHNGSIDWTKVRGNVDFAIIRAGYGKLSTQKDTKFETNYQGCVDNDIPKGAYWYSYATTATEAQTEAKVFLETIKGKKFEYPVYFDIEEKSQANLSTATKSAIVTAFCETMEKNGYFVGVYSYDSFFTGLTDDVKTAYALWVANTSTTPKKVSSYGIHQHSFKGSVSGISGNVDLDNCYVDYPTIIKKAKLNGYAKADTSNYHYDVNNDGTVDNKDLSALHDYLNKS